MIQAEKISKYYGAHAAVSELTLSTQEGEVVGLLGLNGAGKTTTLRILSGLLVPTSGKVSIGGIDMADHPEEARAKIGFLPETPPLYPEMAVEEYLGFVARINGVSGNMKRAIDSALEATDIVDRRDRRIDTLSHGYQRRVGIAHAIVHNPGVILLDEPNSGLDPVQIIQMRTLIRSLRDRHTIVVSSHILSEMHQLCDRILVLHQGKIVAEGSEGELEKGVRKATTVELEVRGGAETLGGALDQVAEVKNHTIRSLDEGIVEATVELEGDARESLAASLVQAGLGIRRLNPTDSGLESIFIQLTGSAASAASAAEARHA